MTYFLKITLAILLFGCLMDFPYFYFQFVRFASTAGFAYLAYEAYEQKNQRDLIIFIVLALLFQPFEKIALGRELWNVVDVVVAVYLISTMKKSKP
jgi:hypothetical protein